ncbi:spore germination protein [Alicyclobacillus hesperidum URH17-3-68]|uniref:Spore germination protein n=1 Tax=Alicyclobacillus hesperidum TaxID=89784 RepID=A0A1H2R1G7_9BACL|nr:endospore germination permease [Alicyclobacillus hesperidum]EJY55432.1 spore germination protein [Alicyclobacillus hesperidum URH17-3-68]GLV13221.1 putative spore germination protein YfkT [Alicyclobacillus hesperidum]SDW13221.1 spore germination protein [Alicyclobacillus hesperidum]
METASSRQIVIMGLCYVFSATLVTWPGQILRLARQDAWIGVPTCALIMLGVLWVVNRTLHAHPGKDLLTLIVEKYGWLGKCLVGAYVLLLALDMGKDLRLGTDFVNVVFLPRTPSILIATLIAATCVFMVRGGIEIVGRMAELYIPLFIVVALCAGLLLIPDLSWQYMQPFFEKGMIRPMVGVWYALTPIGNIMILPMMFSNQHFTFRQSCMAILISCGLLEFVLMICQLNLSSTLAGHLMYPAYEAVREIRLTDFLDRFDLPIVGLWLPTIVIKIGINLYVICTALQRIWPALEARTVVPAVGACIVVFGFWLFHTSVEVVSVNDAWPVLVIVWWIMIPVFACVGLLILARVQQSRLRRPS